MERKRKLFSKIYDKHIDQIYRFVLFKVKTKEIAEDLASEAFSKTWTVFKERGEEIANIQAFLYKTARNLIADHYRHAQKLKVVPINNPGIPDPKQDIEQKSITSSDLEMIQAAISTLKEDYQNVIIWHYIDDLSVSDISEILDRSKDATRVLLHRALKALRRKIEQV